jgi:hypothetical protein
VLFLFEVATLDKHPHDLVLPEMRDLPLIIFVLAHVQTHNHMARLFFVSD